MNETITIAGKEYEVLTLDRIGEAKCAATATGAFCNITTVVRDERPHRAIILDGHAIIDISWKALGIQPLKLIDRVPVSFEVEMGSRGDGFWFPIYCLDDAIAYQHAKKMKFRCVQITEEA